MSHQPYQQQPAWGAPPPAPQPPKKPNKIAGYGCLGIAALLIIAGAIGIAADSSDDTASPSDTAANGTPNAQDTPAKTDTEPTATGETPGLDKRKITELSVGLVWDGYTETQKNALCFGVDAYGEDWLADQLNSDSLDHDYAADLVAAKCEIR